MAIVYIFRLVNEWTNYKTSVQYQSLTANLVLRVLSALSCLSSTGDCALTSTQRTAMRIETMRVKISRRSWKCEGDAAPIRAIDRRYDAQILWQPIKTLHCKRRYIVADGLTFWRRFLSSTTQQTTNCSMQTEESVKGAANNSLPAIKSIHSPWIDFVENWKWLQVK